MSNQITPSEGDSIVCNSCGQLNPAWRTECKNCGKRLMLGSASRSATLSTARNRILRPQLLERPGCVTAYAVLLGIIAAFAGLAGLLFGFTTMINREFNLAAGLVLSVVMLAVGGFYIMVSRGLWELKNWARIVIIVTSSIGLIGPVLSILVVLVSPTSAQGVDPLIYLCLVGVQSAIPGYFLYWFSANGKYFQK